LLQRGLRRTNSLGEESFQFRLIMDSRAALGDAEDELREKNRQIQQLEMDIAELKAQLAKKQQGRKHDGAAWKILDDGSEDGPYCPNCREMTRNFIQPHPGANADGQCTFFCSDHGAQNFAFRVPSSLCSGIATKTPRPSPASP
jgi:hypothetical protein